MSFCLPHIFVVKPDADDRSPLCPCEKLVQGEIAVLMVRNPVLAGTALLQQPPSTFCANVRNLVGREVLLHNVVLHVVPRRALVLAVGTLERFLVAEMYNKVASLKPR